MTFEEIVDQALAMLQRRGRVAYRTLKRQFNLDDEALDDLKVELIEAQQVAIDADGSVLVWTGDVAALTPPASAPAGVRARPPDVGPQTYTPAGTTPINRGELSDGLNKSGSFGHPSGRDLPVRARSRQEEASDEPADPILPQSGLSSQRPSGAGEHSRA